MSASVPTRTLARVARILAIEPIPGADSIQLATVLGFQCVVAIRDGFGVGDLVLYFGLNAVLDDNEDTAFLGGKRITIRKMRGAVSEGLIAPLTWVCRYGLVPEELVEGQDLTFALKVRLWVPQEELLSHRQADDGFSPGMLGTAIPKTDEKRIQEFPTVLQKLLDRRVVATLKMDGCSATYAAYGGSFFAYSRNIDITTRTTGRTFAHYHQYYLQTGLHERLVAYCTEQRVDLALQGELCHQNINGGRTGVKRLEYFVFNIYNIGASRYESWSRVKTVCAALGLSTVPVVFEGVGLPERVRVGNPGDGRSMCGRLVLWADELQYASGMPAEGMVVKSDDDKTDWKNDAVRVSLKVIAPRFLLAIEKRR